MIQDVSTFKGSSKRIFIFGLLISAILVIVPSNAFAGESGGNQKPRSQKEKPKVLIVSLPRVTWKHLQDTKVPNIDSLIQNGSVASFSIRTPGNSRTLEKGYASISAGNRALASLSAQSTFYGPSEQVNHFAASDLFKDQTGIDVKGAAAVSLAFERTDSLNSSGLYQSEVGSFAEALNTNDKSIAVFGNADFCSEKISDCHQRSIGYVGVDRNGIVENGDVSTTLLDKNQNLDMNKVKKLAEVSISGNDVTAVECSNLERADLARADSKLGIGSRNFRRALTECDQMVGSLASKMDLSRDRIYLVSPVSPRTKEQLTVFIAAGHGIRSGYATSGLTRRDGIVALGDIAPSILTFLNVEPPESMLSTLVDWKASTDSVSEKKATLVKTNDSARARDNAFNLVATVFIFIVFVSFVISLIAFRKVPRLRKTAKVLALHCAVMPMVAFLMSPMMVSLATPLLIAFTLVALSAVLAIIGFFAGEKWGYVPVVLFLASANLGVQLLDVITGANLQLNSLFGYSAIVAGRFAGFGNLTFSIVAISAVLVIAMLKELSVTKDWLNSKTAGLSMIGFLVLVLLVDGSPNLGSDIGGVLALTPTICVLALMIFNSRVSIKTFVISVFATIATLSIFSLFDLTRPVSERTHLGRFVKTVYEGNAGAVIERKIISNFHILTNSVVASVVIISTLYLFVLFYYPERYIARNSKNHPALKFIAYPGLLVGLLGMFLNDSGVAIPGMMLVIAFPAVALLAFEIEADFKSNTTSEGESV